MTDPAKPKNRYLPLILVLGALGVYLVLFYATRMPSLESVLPDQGGAEKIFRRWNFLTFLLLPDILVEGWFGSPPEFALADRLPVLALAGAMLAVGASAGWLLLRACRAQEGLTRLETFVFSTAVGLNVLSTYVLLVGLLGLLRNRLVFAVPSVLVLAAAGWLGFGRRGHVAASPATRRPEPRAAEENDILSSRLLWVAVPFVLVILLGGMLPPIDFDVREYHLQVPKEFFEQGRITFLPHNVYGNMAMGTEMLSLLAMGLSGDWWLGALAGKTVIALFAPLTALALWTAGRRFFSPTVGCVAALVYLSIPWVAYVSTAGLVEGAAACYLLLAVYALLLWRDPQTTSPGRLLMAGYLAGSAVATKYPAALFVLMPLAAWVAWASYRSEAPARAGMRRAVPTVIFLLAATVACGLWFGKNWASAGNPTYPLLYKVFGGKTWNAEKDQRWNRVHLPHEFSAGRLAEDLARVGMTSEWLSPLVVPLAALAFVTRRNRRLLWALLAYSAYVIAVWWLLTHRIDRFWIPVLPVVALLAGVGACWNTGRAWRIALASWLVLALTVNFLMASSGGPGRINRYFVSLKRLQEDPLRVDAWHRYFNTSARDGRILLVGDAEVFDLKMPILYNTCFDDSLFEQLVGGQTPAAIRAELASRGITHVFVHWGEIARYRNSGYGFPDSVQPPVFDRLVEQGILRPLPAIEGHPGRGYAVVARVEQAPESR
ncbi:MAG: glycosyltransferase family 39 protein [Thermoguttaceae bacterium]